MGFWDAGGPNSVAEGRAWSPISAGDVSGSHRQLGSREGLQRESFRCATQWTIVQAKHLLPTDPAPVLT